MKKSGILQKIGVIVAIFLTLFPPTNTVFALSSSMLDKFAENNILFYDPEGDDCVNVSATYSTDAAAFGSLSAQQVAFVETYHDIAVMHSINYGIPWETVVAQGILESTSGTSYYARTRNNFFGIGAFDSNPDNAFTYATPEDGWEGYYRNIKTTKTYRMHGVFAGDAVTDPYAYAVAIKAAGYATDENYVSKLSKLIAGIEALSADRGWPSSAELAERYPEWFENAEANRQGATAGGNDASGAAGQVSRCRDSRGSMSLISGGMTLEQAKQFMQAYHDEAMKFNTGTQYFEGARITDSGCGHGTLNNCSAFTQWFLNRYTTLGPTGVEIKQGSEATKNYLALYPQLVDGGGVPRAYAVVSLGPHTGTSTDGWYNHTGIVLGVDKENNSLIIGEAACSFGYAPTAHSYDLKKWTNNPSPFAPKYAYTDNVLKGL